MRETKTTEERYLTRLNEAEADLARRGSVSAHWFLPLDSVSYAGIDVAVDNAAEKLYVSEVPS